MKTIRTDRFLFLTIITKKSNVYHLNYICLKKSNLTFMKKSYSKHNNDVNLYEPDKPCNAHGMVLYTRPLNSRLNLCLVKMQWRRTTKNKKKKSVTHNYTHPPTI